MGFVNDVKCLFAQLGGVSGALLSDSYTTNCSGPQFGSSVLHGELISAVIPRHSSFQESRFTPAKNVGSNQQNSAFHASGIGSQPSPSVARIQDNHQMQTNPCLTPTMSKSLRDLFQVKNLPIMQPNLTLGGQLEARETGAHVILSSSDARLNRQAFPNHPSFRSNDQFSESNSSCSSVTRIGKQIVSDVGLREHASCILPTSVNNSGPPIRSKGGTVTNSGKDSILVSLLGGRLESNPPCQPLKGLQRDLLPSAMQSSSDHRSWSNNCDVLPSLPLQSHPPTDDNHNQTKWTAGKQGIENDVFQSFSILSSHSDEVISRGKPMPDFLSDSWVSSSEHNKERSTSCNIIFENAYVKPPSGDDLFDILGTDLKSGTHCVSWNSSLIQGADSNNRTANIDVSKCITQMDEGPGCYTVNDGISESGIFSETASDHLLDAVVSKVHSGTKQMIDDDISCWTTLTKISNSSVAATGSQTCGQVSAPEHNKQGNFGGLPPSHVKAQKVGSSSFKSGCTKDSAEETSQISSMYGSQVSLAANDSQNMKHDNSISTAHSKRPLEVGKANRKRLKPGDSPRPRPKDRQMIQDRLKELREIVPNVAKCSIDALLECTIKHMLFLQSVTKHADKLKQTGESKIIKEGGLHLKDNFEGGATWAYEVGSQSMVCPIIVEDLNLPGQMLVEMLCEERGLFLEIADIIRGLGLTILKGVMEAHDDKVWVRFTVEANRDVTRMEIFMALVHLLEQAGKNSTSSSKGIVAGNMLAHGTPLQASIPATGQSDNLQ